MDQDSSSRVTDAEMALAYLAGAIRCPGANHKVPEPKQCLICNDTGLVTIEGKSTETIRFYLAWDKKPLSERGWDPTKW